MSLTRSFSDGENGKMQKKSSIDIQLDRRSLEAVIRVFEAMERHYHDPRVIDTAKITVHQSEITDFLAKLRPLVSAPQGPVKIVLNYNDWCVYQGIISDVSFRLPLEVPADLEVIEGLYNQNMEFEARGMAPT